MDGTRARWLPAALIGVGVALRLAWTTALPVATLMIGEANNVAVSFYQHGTIADPFRPGDGPTAHVMTIMPMIAGTVYRALGQGSTAGLILSLLALALLALTWTALYRALALTGMPRPARLGALAVLTLVPFNVALEAVEFRVWEGGLAVALGSTLLWHALALDARQTVTLRAFALLGLHAAVTLFVSPAIGVAAFACGALLMVRRAGPVRWPTIVAAVGAVTIAVLTPWTLRNAAVLGVPIPLRDNFGLEAAQAFYPGAELPGDARARFRARHYAIHPYQPAGHAAMVAAGGEVPYYAALGAQAKAWVAGHPRAATGIALRHLRDMLFPPAWYWSQFGRTGTATAVKLAINWAVSGFGLIGLVYGAVRVRGRFGYVAAMVLLPIVPYLLVEPTLRYRYLIVNLLVFAAAGPVAELVAAIAERRRPALAAPALPR